MSFAGIEKKTSILLLLNGINYKFQFYKTANFLYRDPIKNEDSPWWHYCMSNLLWLYWSGPLQRCILRETFWLFQISGELILGLLHRVLSHFLTIVFVPKYILTDFSFGGKRMMVILDIHFLLKPELELVHGLFKCRCNPTICP